MDSFNSKSEKHLDEVTSLWRSYLDNRTTELRNKLAEHYLPLVKMIAGRLSINLPAHVDRDDLLSSGFFGLLDAIDRYNMERKNKFETYAGVRIRGAMLDYLRSKDWLPVGVRQKIRRYEQAVYDLESRLGRAATDDELADELGMTSKELKTLIGQIGMATVIPLDDYLQVDTPVASDLGPSERLEKEEVADTLATAIGKLPEKEKKVVALYYYEELTLKEIGLILNLSEARISQLHTKAIFRMRGYLERMKNGLI